MKIYNASVEVLTDLDAEKIYKQIELAGRVCYKSEDKIAEGTAEKFIKAIIKRGHESVLEHVSISVRFICDRGISHEIVRHRLASYSQESTRYCNFSQDKFGGEIAVVVPPIEEAEAYIAWVRACKKAEEAYFALLDIGYSPQIARSVLPTCLKTEVIMTANIREWRHFLKLRCDMAAHPQMRELACILRDQLIDKLPVLFGDLI